MELIFYSVFFFIGSFEHLRSKCFVPITYKLTSNLESSSEIKYMIYSISQKLSSFHTITAVQELSQWTVPLLMSFPALNVIMCQVQSIPQVERLHTIHYENDIYILYIKKRILEKSMTKWKTVFVWRISSVRA